MVEHLEKHKLLAEKQAAEAKAKALAANQEKMKNENKAQLKAQALEIKEKITKLLKIENIEFSVGKGTLTTKGTEVVSKLAVILEKYPNVKVEIAGHTDSDGSEVFNQKLSQERVNSVKTTLISKNINKERLTAKGYGESQPLVANTTKENKQMNRRVEFNILGQN